MLKRLYWHIQKNVYKSEDKNILLLRLLLLIIMLCVIYLIFVPSQTKDVKQIRRFIINGEEHRENELFRMSTTQLCAAVAEAKIAILESDIISVAFLKKQEATQQFITLPEPVIYEVKDGDCIPTFPLCQNNIFKYCFSIDTHQIPIKINYKLI